MLALARSRGSDLAIGNKPKCGAAVATCGRSLQGKVCNKVHRYVPIEICQEIVIR